MPRTSIACIAAVAGAVAALAPPVIAQAHDYCTDRIHNNGVTGALVGGAAGALIGNSLAHGGGRTGGTLLGAAAGAAVGSNVARSTTKDHCRGPREAGDYGPPPPPVYVAPARIYAAPPPPPPPYGYVVYDGPHDHGEHRGWYKHHHHDDDEGGRGHDHHDHDHHDHDD